jgi:hypothetical protein
MRLQDNTYNGHLEYFSNIITNQSDGISGPTAIMGGHEILLNANRFRDLGIFPKRTLELAKEIASNARLQINDIHLFTLIDDKEAGKKARTNFWNQHRYSLYDAYEDISFYKSELLEPIMLRSVSAVRKRDRGLWSEQRLCNMFRKRLSKSEELSTNVANASNEIKSWRSGIDTTCDTGVCGLEPCSREVIEVIAQLCNKGYQRVIMLVPDACTHFVDDAAEVICEESVAKKIFETDTECRIYNCFLNSGKALIGGNRVIPQSDEDIFNVSNISSHTLSYSQ